MIPIWLQIAGAALLAVLAALLHLSNQLKRQQRLQQRLDLVRTGKEKSVSIRQRKGSGASALVASLGAGILRRKLLSAGTVDGMRKTVLAAGMRSESALGLFIGGKILLLGAMPVAAYLLAGLLDLESSSTLLFSLVAAILGMMLPDLIVGRIRNAYVKKVDKGMADALDMMVICAEAGQNLESTISRVAAELRYAHPETGQELAATANDLVIMTDSRAALAAMGERTGVPGLRRIATTMMQSLQYGTPLAHALRTLAAELRTEMLTRYEKQAAQLPVLLTIPMILLILPSLFVLIGGPAVLQMMSVMSK